MFSIPQCLNRNWTKCTMNIKTWRLHSCVLLEVFWRRRHFQCVDIPSIMLHYEVNFNTTVCCFIENDCIINVSNNITNKVNCNLICTTFLKLCDAADTLKTMLKNIICLDSNMENYMAVKLSEVTMVFFFQLHFRVTAIIIFVFSVKTLSIAIQWDESYLQKRKTQNKSLIKII